MRSSILKTAVAAALALAGTIGLSRAEPPAPLNPDQLGALVQKHNAQRTAGTAPAAQGGRSGVQALANGTNNAPTLVSGWNTLQCSTAYWYFDGTYTYLFGFNVNPSSYLYAWSTSVNLTALQATLLNACGSGAFYHAYLDASQNILALENR